MKKGLYITGLLSLVLLIHLSSCSSKEDSSEIPSIPAPKVGLISGVGGFNDRGFNQLALSGLQRAAKDLGVKTSSRESLDTSDFTPNINALIQEGYDLIILLGFEASGAVSAAAKANPGIHFALLDYSENNIPFNLLYYVYQVDQSAFLCGFLGAYWAQLKDPANPMACWIGGLDIPVIEQFKTGYQGGIKYFNDKYMKSVGISGFFATSFSDTLQGAKLADSLILQGADVIFPFAGKTGNGALYKMKEKGKWGIGVDLDQYTSIPAVSDILLTSCLKKIDNTIYDIIYYTGKDGFTGRKISYGSLGTYDVGIAPYHDYDALIPDTIKNEIELIRSGIIDGTINTGWSVAFR
jgi:basic membrane protein A and related proteins